MSTNESTLIQLPVTFAADQDATPRASDHVVAHRPRQTCLNHNETVLAGRPVGRGIGINHNETVLAARSVGRGIGINHNETVFTGTR